MYRLAELVAHPLVWLALVPAVLFGMLLVWGVVLHTLKPKPCGLLCKGEFWRSEDPPAALTALAGYDVDARYVPCHYGHCGGVTATALHWAAQNAGDPLLVEALLERGAKVDASDSNGQSPLHWAAAHNSKPEMIELLIEHGANIGATGASGATPLHLAVFHSNEPEIIELLMERGAKVDANDSNGQSPLHWAAAHNSQPEIIELFIGHGANINAMDAAGATPLHLSLIRRHTEAAALLLDAGADAPNVDIDTAERMTLLHVASYRGDLTGIVSLLDQGVDINAEDSGRETPLHTAVRNNRLPAVMLLLERGAHIEATNDESLTALHLAASLRNDTKIVEILLDHGAAIAGRHYYGETPLHAAAANGEPAVIQVLLDNGADIMARTGAGVTSLHLAASNNDAGVVAPLLDHGADVVARTGWGVTPLHLAAEHSSAPAVIELLLERGANVNEKTGSAASRGPGGPNSICYSYPLPSICDDDLTPLHLSVEHNDSPAIVELLLERGANVNAGSERGYTPLHRAAIGNADPTIIELLLSHGANSATKTRNREEQTACHLAISQNVSSEAHHLLCGW